MERNAKETRRSQAYSPTVGVEGGGGLSRRRRGGCCLPHHTTPSLFPLLFPHALSLQRPHVCQPSSGASLLSTLPIFVVSPAVFLPPLLSCYGFFFGGDGLMLWAVELKPFRTRKNVHKSPKQVE